MKKRSEHLRILPAEIIAEVKAIMKIQGVERLLSAGCNKNTTLLAGIDFTDTEQGHAYWWAIHTQYFKD